MEDASLERKTIIASLTKQQPESIADTATVHWDRLADEIISIVGEAGFTSLYERTLHLVQPNFPWLKPDSSPPQAPENHRFAALGARFANQEPAEACAAHHQLLTIFTDILASLIGEQLTSNILRVAWGTFIASASGKERVK